MAKTDHFYIRAQVDNATANFEQVSIDLGAFVDALGKSVLRIHSISVHFDDRTNPGQGLSLLAGNTNCLSWQLTTQSQTAIVNFDDKSVISLGQTNFASFSTVAGLAHVQEVGDRVDQTWEDGYLVAVEQIFFSLFGGQQAGWSVVGDAEATIILDCTVESLTKDAAMALALSQQ
jgi:hypothetical protein